MGATTNKTPARGTAASERNSGAASSNSPKYAISRSTRRSAGSLSKEIGASSSERKADRFGSHPCSVAGGSIADSGPVGSNKTFCSGCGSFQPIRRSRLRTAVSLTPSRRAISRLECPSLLSRSSLFHQIDSRMGLGDAIAHSVVGQHNPRNDHPASALLGAHQTSIINDLCTVHATRNREQLGLSFGVFHRTPSYRSKSKKRTGLVRTPRPLPKAAFSL